MVLCFELPRGRGEGLHRRKRRERQERGHRLPRPPRFPPSGAFMSVITDNPYGCCLIGLCRGCRQYFPTSCRSLSISRSLCCLAASTGTFDPCALALGVPCSINCFGLCCSRTLLMDEESSSKSLTAKTLGKKWLCSILSNQDLGWKNVVEVLSQANAVFPSQLSGNHEVKKYICQKFCLESATWIL